MLKILADFQRDKLFADSFLGRNTSTDCTAWARSTPIFAARFSPYAGCQRVPTAEHH